jgi:LysR family transcriptional regulator of gallate degradation
MINTKHLRAFSAVARFGSIVRASETLGRVASATARSVRELEAALGAPLFERHPHGMILSDIGRILQRRVEGALAELGAARAAFAADLRGARWSPHAPIFTLSVSRQRLLAFLMLAEQHSMTAAAASLGLTQPAVSQAVREIEASIGVKLFKPVARGMLPTPLGALLALHVKRALAELRTAEDEIGSSTGVVLGTVRVGTLSLGRTRLLPLAVTRLLQRHPSLAVHTEEGSFEYLSTRLREGEIDFMLGALRPPEQTRGFVREAIASDRMEIIVRAAHPLAAREPLAFSDIMTAGWILPKQGTPTRDLIDACLAARGGERPTVQVETADLSITLGILLASDMATAASPHLFRREIEAGLLVVLPIALPETARAVGILRRPGSTPPLGARLLIETMREIGEL